MPPSRSDDQERNFRRIDRILARAFVREFLRHRSRQPAAGSGRTLQPRMDLCDDPTSSDIVAILELPGLKHEDMTVRIENEELIVQGERPFRPLIHRSRSQAPSPDTDHDTASEPIHAREERASSAEVAHSQMRYGYTTQEIKYGMFERRVALPQGTQVEHIRASLTEGMLTLSWPRNPLEVPESWQGQEEPTRSTGLDG